MPQKNKEAALGVADRKAASVKAQIQHITREGKKQPSNDNKKVGNTFERDLCLSLSGYGFWAHNLAQNSQGQPFDVLAAKDGTVIAASFWGKLKTVVQFIAIIYTLTALEFSTWSGSLLQAFALPEAVYTVPLVIGEVLLWISVVLTAVAGVEYVWGGRHFFKGEK